MNNPVHWFEIYVDNMERAKAFYEQVFAIELTSLDMPGIDMWCFPANHEQTGSSGALIKEETVSAGHNSTVVYFACEDCALEESRTEPAGGSVHRTKMSIGEHGFVSLIKDTEGNLIGLYSQK